MATFFDKFRRYAKDYVRERSTKEPDTYGHLTESVTSRLAIKGILTRKSVRGSSVQEGHASIGYWTSEDVFYVGPEVDIASGDVLVNGDIRYQCEHKEAQDDFQNKNSHFVVYLKRIS